MQSTILLDTNILVLAIRNAAVWTEFREKHNIELNNCCISIVTEAEILSLAEQFGWGESKLRQLRDVLNHLTIIPLNEQAIVNAYIHIDLYSQKKLRGVQYPSHFTPRNMGKNDVWIAATANALDATLISTDKDYEHLHGLFFDFHHIEY